MDINSAFNSGLQALQSAQVGMTRSAEAIARRSGGIGTSSTVETALVRAADAQRQSEAATKVVKTADETLGALIDLRA